MDATIRRLETADAAAVARLLDHAVGAGFWHLPRDGDLSFAAVADTGPAGVVLAALEPPGDVDARFPFGRRLVPAVPPAAVLHVHAVAVAPRARRSGLARRLLARAEQEAADQGASVAYLFAWLPAGRPDPGAVRLYRAAGYDAGPDIGDFYAAGSLFTASHCPYCGPPPCRCAARPFVKRLASA